MADRIPSRILIIGAGAAGLMAARELAMAGAAVTVLEARDRLGGRILTLPESEFGYAAEGGPEFIHGEAKVTHELIDAAGLSLLSQRGERWDARDGRPVKAHYSFPDEKRLEEELAQLAHDMPIAAFLQSRFGDDKYKPLRTAVLRMVEGYDAADPSRASTFAVRDEWMQPDHPNGRIAEGYGALIRFLATDTEKHGARIHLNSDVVAIDIADRAIVRCRDGSTYEAAAIISTVPFPVLRNIAVTPDISALVKMADDIGFGDVIKFLYRFKSAWWAEVDGGAMRDMGFLISGQPVPTWWTQRPRPVPVLTGWCAGPNAARLPGRTPDELNATALSSLAHVFGRPLEELQREVVAWRAIHWGADRWARGGYSYATPETRAAQAALSQPMHEKLFFSGEALYGGIDMGTVEAALASGRDTAKRLLASRRYVVP